MQRVLFPGSMLRSGVDAVERGDASPGDRNGWIGNNTTAPERWKMCNTADVPTDQIHSAVREQQQASSLCSLGKWSMDRKQGSDCGIVAANGGRFPTAHHSRLLGQDVMTRTSQGPERRNDDPKAPSQWRPALTTSSYIGELDKRRRIASHAGSAL